MLTEKQNQLIEELYREKMAENGRKGWISRTPEEQKAHIALMTRKRWIGWKKSEKRDKDRIKNNL